jgi:hypothetical protein
MPDDSVFYTPDLNSHLMLQLQIGLRDSLCEIEIIRDISKKPSRSCLTYGIQFHLRWWTSTHLDRLARAKAQTVAWNHAHYVSQFVSVQM